MKSLVLDSLLALFPGVRSTTVVCRPVQGTVPFVFVPEGSPFDREVMVEQADKLIMSAISALEGPDEAEVVAQLLRFRDELSGRSKVGRSDEVEALHLETMATVNDYFKRRLYALPGIAAYLDEIAATGDTH